MPPSGVGPVLNWALGVSPLSRVQSEFHTGRTRRKMLAGSGGLCLSALAGCSAVTDLLVDFTYRDLNVLNDSDGDVEMHIVIHAESETVLDTSLSLEPSETRQYGDLWNAEESYAISVELGTGEQAQRDITARTGDDPVVITYGEELVIDYRGPGD